MRCLVCTVSWCTWPSLRPVYRGRPCTGYMTRAVYRPYTTMHGPCTFRKHAREHGTRLCRQALNTAVFTVRTRLCTRAVNTPVYRVHSRTRPCSGHGRTMYMAHAWSCTVCTRPWSCTLYMGGPCTPAVKTARCTAVHDHAWAMYMVRP